MSLSEFYKSPSVPKSPLEEIAASENINDAIRTMVSPERIDGLVKRRLCLVFEADMDKHGARRAYILLAVTHFDGKTMFETDIPPEKKVYALPIAPNKNDILD
jgi:hypothetical protein